MSKKYTNYSDFSTREKKEEIKVENSPEEKIEKTVEPEAKKDEKPKVYKPTNAVLLTNVYIRETPYGNKVDFDSLDRFLSSKTICDSEKSAIVPKGTKVTVYKTVSHEDGSKWLSTEFGYLMATNKDGKEFIK